MRRMRTPPLTPGIAVLIGLAVIDAATGSWVALAGYFGLAVLVAAAVSGPRATAWLGLAAVATAVVSGVWDDRFGTSQHWAAIVLVLCQAVAGVYVAAVRRDREVELLARKTELLNREIELTEVRAVAEVAQRALLPSVPACLDGVGFAARYLSAAQAASVGGDLYEVVRTAHTVRVIIGDVKGKGLPAVRLAAVVLGAFREAATTWLDPEQVAAACARAVSREADAEDFVTALLVDMHADGRLSLCSAGHHPPYLLSDGSVSQLRMAAPSPPLGIAERFTATTSRWAVDDRLLLFTDGLIEARDHRGEFFPIEMHLAGLGDHPLESALDRLTDELSAHVGGALHDDMALVLAQRQAADTGAGAGASRLEPVSS